MGAMRHEIKYMISFNQYLVFRNKLEKVLKYDPVSHGLPYTITSLYYDDTFESALKEKLDGEAVRHKYRLRYYNNAVDMLKLECKSKVNQMTLKHSECYKESSDLKSIFQHLVNAKKIKPKSLVRYERVAFIHPVGKLRVTFDLNVRGVVNEPFLEQDESCYQPLLASDEVIMEVKFNGVIPSFLWGMLQSDQYMALSSSKYVYSRLPVM